MTIIRSCYIIASMKHRRVNYDYDRVIMVNHLEKAFKHYCYCHPKIKSRKRLARNFLLSLGFRQKDFVTETLIGLSLKEQIRIAKVNWL